MTKRQWKKICQQCCLVALLASGCVAAPADNLATRQSPAEISLTTENTDTAMPAQPDPAIKALADLVAVLPPGTVLAFTGLSGLAGEKTDLAGIVAFKLEPILVNLCRDKAITLIERDKLQLILNEWKLEMGGLTKSDQGARELLGADIILTGKVKVELPNVHLLLKTIHLKDGKIMAASEIRQPAEQYGKAALEESKTTVTVTAATMQQQPKTNQAVSDDGKIKLWTVAETYAVGDKMTVFFEVSEAAYVTVVDITPDGEKTIIFPNSYQENNFCKPGIVYQIPPPDASFVLEVTEPAGKDRIMAMTSHKPQVDQSVLKTRGLKFTNAIVNTTNSRVSIAFDIY